MNGISVLIKGARVVDHHVKQNKPDSERQVLCFFSYEKFIFLKKT
jgi:hypothetical protein